MPLWTNSGKVSSLKRSAAGFSVRIRAGVPNNSELAEWLIAPPWKGDDPNGSVSSNLTLAASNRSLV